MADHPVPASAEAPTPEQAEDERAAAAQINQQFVNAVERIREDMWNVARWAYEADQEVIWLKLGYETKGEWLATPEIHMTRSTFDRMARVWRETTVNRHLAPPTLAHLDPSKVDIVLPKVNKHEVTMEDAIADVEAMGSNDLREKYQRPQRQSEPEPEDEAVFDDEELAKHDVELPPDPEDDQPAGDETDPRGDEDGLVELEPYAWAVAALEAIRSGCEHDPWLSVFRGAGEGADGLKAVADFALEQLADDPREDDTGG